MGIFNKYALAIDQYTQKLYSSFMKNLNPYNPVKEAIEIVGSQVALAKICGVSQPTVFKWLKKSEIPAKRVLLVEKQTGISRYKLNPLIYPSE